LTPSEALTKIEELRLSSVPYEQQISRLGIIAVLNDVKSAFMGDEEECLEEYKEAGRRLGLRVLVTKRPPTDTYPIRKPRVPLSFVSAFHEVGEYKDKRAVWLYKEPKTSQKISQSVSGQLDEGYVLGYPKCCIRAYGDDRAILVETVYNHIIDHYHAKTAQEAVRILLTDPPFPAPKTRVRESFEKFPFTSHVACSYCLQGKSEESSKLNQELRKLAAQAGLKERVIESVTDLLASGLASVVKR
jgi:hypothetical protein